MEISTAATGSKNCRMNIASALNSKYVRYTYVMLTSLFHNNPEAEIHVYLLHNDLSCEEQKLLSSLAEKYGNQLHFLHLKRSDFPASLPTTESWSLEAYFRLTLTDILPPEVDRLLYLDVDIIVANPLNELYFTDFEDAYFCVCRDMGTVYPFPDIRNELFRDHLATGKFTYFNSGVMLWNIEKLRGRYGLKNYLALAEKLNYQILAPDQDLLNYMHWQQIKLVDEYQYNLFARFVYKRGIRYEEVREQTVIVHYPGMKPWEGQYFHYDIEQLWWDYAKMTPFYHEFMETFLYQCINSPLIYDTTTQMSNENKQLYDELGKSTELCKKLLAMLEQHN